MISIEICILTLFLIFFATGIIIICSCGLESVLTYRKGQKREAKAIAMIFITSLLLLIIVSFAYTLTDPLSSPLELLKAKFDLIIQHMKGN